MSKTVILSVISVALIALSLGCVSQSPYSQLPEIGYESLDESWPFNERRDPFCDSLAGDRDDNFVIDSVEDYGRIFDVKLRGPRCENFTLPEPGIDFSQKTVLGKFAGGGGCSGGFRRNVYRDDENNRVIYSIRFAGEGMCDKFIISMNWIAIPKVPSGYQVVFDVE